MVTHGDFHKGNVLFKNGKLVTLLDFDEVQIAPRVNDVAYALKQTCLAGLTLNSSRVSVFIKEYEKLIKLGKIEKAMIPLLILRDNCVAFWWIYNEMEKGQDKKSRMLSWTVKSTKILAKENLR
jgi:Ser/Thr protein kinase RdoA (MazF antagonist)